MSDLGTPNDANASPGTKKIEPPNFEEVHRHLSGPPLVRIAYNAEGEAQTAGAPPKRRTELAQNGPQGTDQHKYFSTDKPDPDLPTEIEIAGHGLDAFQNKTAGYMQLKEFINQNGRDPTAAVVDAIKKTNVVGLGELHEDAPPNPPRDWAAAHMRDFARAGTTDLFVELPKVLQPVFDKFNNDPKKGPFQIPDKIIGPDGKPIDTPVAKGALELLRDFDPDFFKMWAAAREAGIKVHAVDNDANGWLYYSKDPNNPEAKRLTALRKQDMAANMLSILGQPTKPGEPPHKGIAWMGNVDIADGPGYQGTPSLKIMKDALAKKGEKVASFFTQNAESNGDAQWSVFPLAATVNRPVAAPTHGADGKPNVLGRMTTLGGHAIPYNYDNWDQIILFPPTNK
jgi:hypothetical protein